PSNAASPRTAACSLASARCGLNRGNGSFVPDGRAPARTRPRSTTSNIPTWSRAAIFTRSGRRDAEELAGHDDALGVGRALTQLGAEHVTQADLGGMLAAVGRVADGEDGLVAHRRGQAGDPRLGHRRLLA